MKMYLNSFNIKFKKCKRVGRGIGSGLGKTSGRGHKGQKARSGYSLRRCFEGGQTSLNIRLPKFGFKSNKPFVHCISSGDLNNFSDNFDINIINILVLKNNGIIKKRVKFVKIIYNRSINKVLKLSGILVSNKVKNNIEKLGGYCN